MKVKGETYNNYLKIKKISRLNLSVRPIGGADLVSTCISPGVPERGDEYRQIAWDAYVFES